MIESPEQPQDLLSSYLQEGRDLLTAVDERKKAAKSLEGDAQLDNNIHTFLTSLRQLVVREKIDSGNPKADEIVRIAYGLTGIPMDKRKSLAAYLETLEAFYMQMETRSKIGGSLGKQRRKTVYPDTAIPNDLLQ